jgi:hypothetical protein
LHAVYVPARRDRRFITLSVARCPYKPFAA